MQVRSTPEQQPAQHDALPPAPQETPSATQARDVDVVEVDVVEVVATGAQRSLAARGAADRVPNRSWSWMSGSAPPFGHLTL